MPESAFIVRVPEAEPHVSHYREQYDSSARLGVPAHITVLYPFMSPELITVPILEQVRASLSDARGFDFRLTHVGRFPGVVYLAPEPDEPFASLTRAIAQAFPAYPPYRGQHAAVVPHLTVAQVDESKQGEITTGLESSLGKSGSIASHCSELVLIENSTGRWEPMHVLRLGASPGKS